MNFQIWRFFWMLLRAIENAVAGHIWPAGRYLPTPGLVVSASASVLVGREFDSRPVLPRPCKLEL